MHIFLKYILLIETYINCYVTICATWLRATISSQYQIRSGNKNTVGLNAIHKNFCTAWPASGSSFELNRFYESGETANVSIAGDQLWCSHLYCSTLSLLLDTALVAVSTACWLLLRMEVNWEVSYRTHWELSFSRSTSVILFDIYFKYNVTSKEFFWPSNQLPIKLGPNYHRRNLQFL